MSKVTISSNESATEQFPLKLVEKIYTRLVLEMNFELTPKNISMYLITLMRLVEYVTLLKGRDKKNLVIQVMEYLITEQIKDDNDYKEHLIMLVKLTLPDLIDVLISIDKKELTIKLKKGIKKLFSICFSKSSKHKKHSKSKLKK